MKKRIVNGLERVDKRKAFEIYKAGEPVYIIACNLIPTTVGSLTFAMSCNPSLDNCPRVMRGCAARFEDRVEDFKKQYCSTETGTYPAFYIKVDDNNKDAFKDNKYTLEKAKWNDYGWDGNIFSLYYGDFKDKDGDEFNVCVEYRKDIDKFCFYMQYAEDEIIYLQSDKRSRVFFEYHISKEYMKFLTKYMRKLMGEGTSDSVTTICYGEQKVWKSRKEAEEFFLKAMTMSEGAERERYVNIYTALKEGKKVCSDEVE